MPLIQFETLIHAPTGHVFDLNLDVDAHAAAFADTNERAVAGVTRGRMTLGDTVTWEAVHFGLRQRLTTRITRYERPHLFQDEMVSGAFHSFQHLHTFMPMAAGTLMTDRFTYTAPLGVLGRLADRLFLAGYLQRLLLRRAAHLKAVAERTRRGAASC